MGIANLMRYMCSMGGRGDSGGDVCLVSECKSFKAIAKERRENGYADGRSNVLVIDGMNVVRSFLKGTDWFCGGQHPVIERNVRRFIERLKDAGFE